MSMPSRLEYIKTAKQRYLKAPHEEKSTILDELCANTGYNRKYAIRQLSAKIALLQPTGFQRKKRKSCTYSNEDIYWLAKVWEVLDYPCGQRLAPVLAQTLAVLISFHELDGIPDSTVAKLHRIKSATIDDRLFHARQKLRRKLISTTKPGSLIKKHIPIRTSSWNESRIGCCEIDTVAHCGNSADGDFINSLNITDMRTQWTETVALMGKAQKRIMNGLDTITARLPFPIIALDPDNGSEFINWQLFRWCMEQKIEFTRGRPYHKNDNAHIEQKNWTHVRKLFGYERLETTDQLSLMNDVYGNEWRLYKNFFIPCMKLKDKQRVGKYGEKIKRVYDTPATPYQRALSSPEVKAEVKRKLIKQFHTLNPAQLRRQIIAKQKQFKKMIP
jgi:hypothetical protein